MAQDPETATVFHPVIKWAQRSNADDATKNLVFLTVEVMDPVDMKIDLTETSLSFEATGSESKVHYKFHIDFYQPIDEAESTYDTKVGSHVFFVLRKSVKQAEYWPRLTKDKLRHPSIKTDFDKWVDEDEQDEHRADDDDMLAGMGGAGAGAGGMDFSQLMAGMGGAGGPGGAGGAGPSQADLMKLMSQMGQAGGDNADGDLSNLASTLGKAGGDEKEEEAAEEK
ncbi:hypothetical protein DIURU_000688 [Diutina rugosa]|uniref:CS domain-containing protein n=1 Tax=Diutina rugosa TaxID=5481 RepID=A0A642UYF9_DIURU|nr:uncharacterized protein DIURU_000688 [Diutina rugosa]KAA8907004.1 hypothetical protein DIURU_000688 [Diutina rugosa]